ncbi:MAG: NADH-quinone oxidoreductase subunit N [Deltaproteobacteria bacterium]|nr:NADH-quinone oxidoreductase subunit N [Deltaproteobacteria bacterium]
MSEGALLLLLPELLVLAGALIGFLLAVTEASRRIGWVVSLLFALGAAAAAAATILQRGQPFFPRIYQVDLFSQVVKAGLGVALFLVLLISRDLPTVRPWIRREVPMFLFLTTLGMMMLASATELLTLYVAMEFSAYGLYILVALHRAQRPGSEAAAKYVLFGAAASAVTLYGISLLFGVGGSTYLADLYRADLAASPLFLVGLVMTMAGFFYKLSLFPFHFWTPDAYQAAPHPVTTFLASASKLAAMALLARATGVLASSSPARLMDLLLVLSVASMTLGNLAALVQKDLKRLLAYSTIAHAGYMVVGLYAFSSTGHASALFYALTYVPVAITAFVVISALDPEGDKNPTFESLAGLYKRSPALALLLLVAMFGLAGIPPTVGFAGKWFVFAAALERGQFALVLIAAVNSTVGLYYYLQVIRAAFLTPAADETPLRAPAGHLLAGYGSALLSLGLGIFPGPLWLISELAAGALRAWS